MRGPGDGDGAGAVGGRITRVAGPVVGARGLERARLYDVVRVGPARLMGEVIRLDGDAAVIQVYEDTSGLRAGDPVEGTGAPLEVELGPGLLGAIFDGIERPLSALAADGPFIARGADLPAIARDRVFSFEPTVSAGDEVGPGDILGRVPESGAFVHRILVPPGIAGRVTALRAGPVRADEPVARVGGRAVGLLQRWPARSPRPCARRLDPDVPLVSGQRAIDALFPLARGGAATIPGGFGTGKTVLEQTFARSAEVDVVVYVGCGERGNELTEVLEELPRALDPRTGAPLLERTVLIANTSNMPVAAREASIYTGITIAEYFRDQGYDVALLADSTSRWGEALREVSARLEEMPGEEGYPAYLAARLAELYERAGAVVCLGRGERRGSVSVVGAVSPPSGDFSEPVTQASLRIAGAFWALDTDLARRRHFPAIHWGRSYSLYDLGRWFAANVAPDWEELRRFALAVLGEEAELAAVVQLLGAEALAPAERHVLETARRLREDFLQQSAFDPVDARCPPAKQVWMLRAIREAHRAGERAVAREVPLEAIAAVPAAREIARMREWPPEVAAEHGQALCARLAEEIGALEPPPAAAGSCPARGGGP